MADFQFYRPQANALEQLWAQYADSEGKKGGAYQKAFADAMAPGLERLGQNLEQRRERKFQEERQEDAQKFQTEEREAAQTFQSNERFLEQWWKSDEAKLDRAARLAEATTEAGAKVTAATTEATAKANAATAEALAKTTAAKTYLAGQGYNDADATRLALQLGDLDNAKDYVNGQVATAEAKRKEAADLAAKNAALKAASNATVTLDELSDPEQPWGKSLPKGEIGRLRAKLASPATANEAAQEVEQLGSRLRLAGSSIQAAKSYDTWVKKNQSLLKPTHSDIVGAEMRKVKGFADSLADPNQAAYYLQNPQVFDQRLEDMRKSREIVEDTMAGYGPEAKFWRSEAERGRGELRPKPGQSVVIDSSTGSVLLGLSEQEAAQLEDAALQEARQDINYANMLNNDSRFVGMGLLAQTPEERMQALRGMMETSEAERVSKELEKITAKSRERVLKMRGYKVLVPLTAEIDSSDVGKKLDAKVDSIYAQFKPTAVKIAEAIEVYKQAGFHNQTLEDELRKEYTRVDEEMKNFRSDVKAKTQSDRAAADSRMQQRSRQRSQLPNLDMKALTPQEQALLKLITRSPV